MDFLCAHVSITNKCVWLTSLPFEERRSGRKGEKGRGEGGVKGRRRGEVKKGRNK